ncbi:MAG: DUF72 domain-containing protein [Candidatus Caldatribacteriaceae bacterium]
MIRVGVCGFPASYASLFSSLDVIEIQKTFYAPLSERQLLSLLEKRPPHFIFTMKAFQGITHPSTSPTYRRVKLPSHFFPHNLGFFKPTPEVWESVEITLREARILEAQLVVIQCPPSFLATPENLDHLYQFFRNLKRNHLIWGFEPRGNWSWEIIQKVCEEFDLVHVVDPFYGSPVAGSIQYFRLHGRGSYHYRYTQEEIKELAQKLRTSVKETYCLFNNTFMFENALELKKELEKEKF